MTGSFLLLMLLKQPLLQLLLMLQLLMMLQLHMMLKLLMML